MHLKARPPIFVPHQFQAEIEKLSKAALMDIVWDYATRCCAADDDSDAIMEELRVIAALITGYRKQGGRDFDPDENDESVAREVGR